MVRERRGLIPEEGVRLCGEFFRKGNPVPLVGKGGVGGEAPARLQNFVRGVESRAIQPHDAEEIEDSFISSRGVELNVGRFHDLMEDEDDGRFHGEAGKGGVNPAGDDQRGFFIHAQVFFRNFHELFVVPLPLFEPVHIGNILGSLQHGCRAFRRIETNELNNVGERDELVAQGVPRSVPPLVPVALEEFIPRQPPGEQGVSQDRHGALGEGFPIDLESAVDEAAVMKIRNKGIDKENAALIAFVAVGFSQREREAGGVVAGNPVLVKHSFRSLVAAADGSVFFEMRNRCFRKEFFLNEGVDMHRRVKGDNALRRRPVRRLEQETPV